MFELNQKVTSKEHDEDGIVVKIEDGLYYVNLTSMKPSFKETFVKLLNEKLG